MFAVEEICERSESAIGTKRNREEFVEKYTDLLDREYPECERPDDGNECDCYLCEELARFYEHCWEIEELWDQVFGFSFRKDGSYFRLVIVFWMPSGERAKSSLLNHCADLQYGIDERTELFSVQFFFVTKSGRVMDSEELFWELNPQKKIEHDRYENFWNTMTEEWRSKYMQMRMDYVFGFLDEMQPKTDPSDNTAVVDDKLVL